ncbi:MAG: flagellar type III secretion system protein FlhB [Pseudomonadota bacterium]
MAEGQSQDESESKIHEPTPRRLEQARQKGDIPRSADLTAAIGYLGVLLAGVVAGGVVVEGIGAASATLIGEAHTLAPMLFSGHAGGLPGALLRQTTLATLPLFAVPFVLVVLGLLAQRALLFTPDKLMPKLSRISLIQNAKQKFGLSGLVEFAKSFVKLIAYSAALGVYLAFELEGLVLSSMLEPRQASLLIGRLALEFMAIIVVISFVIGAVDFIWQVADHRRRNRMSHKELRDETKETEGDPYLKERRRQKSWEIAQNPMIADVANATVVITNPTHYAIALQWTRASAGAPLCLAKGVDAVALRIREAADLADIPIHEDAPTARALYATVEIGEEIGRDHFLQVAAAIRFAENVQAKAQRSVL